MAFVQDRFIFDDTTSASVSAFLTSVRAHPRFRLRFIAIVAASCGCFFNFLTLFLTLFGFRDGDLAIFTGCAYIPLLLSIIWHHFDLASKRLLTRDLSPALLVLGDGLACLGFLIIIIISGILSGAAYESGVVVLTTYNSVPWMICYCVHLIITLRAIVRAYDMIFNSIRSPHRCVSCGHPKPTWGGASGKDGMVYTPLGSQDHDDDDVEANVAAKKTEEMVPTAASPDQAHKGRPYGSPNEGLTVLV